MAKGDVERLQRLVLLADVKCSLPAEVVAERGERDPDWVPNAHCEHVARLLIDADVGDLQSTGIRQTLVQGQSRQERLDLRRSNSPSRLWAASRACSTPLRRRRPGRYQRTDPYRYVSSSQSFARFCARRSSAAGRSARAGADEPGAQALAE